MATKTLSSKKHGAKSNGNGATRITLRAPARPSVRVRQTKMLIDGKWVNSVSGRTFETINPATGEVIAHVAAGEAAAVAKPAKAARKAFAKGRRKKMSSGARARVICTLAGPVWTSKAAML